MLTRGTQQLRQLRDIAGNPSRLIAREQHPLGRELNQTAIRASVSPRSFALLCLFRNFAPGPSHFLHHFLMHFCLSFRSQTITLCGKLAILIGRSHLDNSSGSLAMFAAVRRALTVWR
jgi:hypothetical protein